MRTSADTCWRRGNGGPRSRCCGGGGVRPRRRRGGPRGRGGACHLGLSRQFLPAHNASTRSSCQLADARRVSVRPAQALVQPRAVGPLEGATQAHAATQNRRLLNQLALHSPQSFALHASQEPHRAALADLAAALLCGFAGGATTSSSSVASTSSALACSSALRLSTFAGDRPLCLESTFCQNSSNSRSVINWLHSRLRDSMLARGAHQTPTVPAIAFLALRTAWTEMTNNRSFAVRRRCLEIAVISILDNQRTH